MWIGTRILPPEGPFRITFWEHISAPNEDIFTKFGWYVGNELPQGVKWSKHRNGWLLKSDVSI